MYFTNIPYRYWDILNQLYQNATTHVSWNREISEPFELHQGVRLGGILSSHLHKQFNNNFGLDQKIKNSEPTSDISKYQHQYAQMIFAALPTIRPVDLQTCLYIVEDYVNKHRCKDKRN
jgi:hypothetical protein